MVYNNAIKKGGNYSDFPWILVKSHCLPSYFMKHHWHPHVKSKTMNEGKLQWPPLDSSKITLSSLLFYETPLTPHVKSKTINGHSMLLFLFNFLLHCIGEDNIPSTTASSSPSPQCLASNAPMKPPPLLKPYITTTPTTTVTSKLSRWSQLLSITAQSLPWDLCSID